MPDNVSRRDFLKFGGFASAGVAATGLGLSSVVGCSSETVVTETDFVYTCPSCGKYFTEYDALKKHMEESHPGLAVPEMAALNINGNELKVQIEPHWTLRQTLQYAVGLTGSAKEMCDRGECGSCSVLIDGEPALSCTTLACECVGRQIETVEGIAADPEWAPLVDAYVKWDTMQCGYCTPGQLAIAKYILTQNTDPDEDYIRETLAGNLCRCGTYSRHISAIQEAAAVMNGRGGDDNGEN